VRDIFRAIPLAADNFQVPIMECHPTNLNHLKWPHGFVIGEHALMNGLELSLVRAIVKVGAFEQRESFRVDRIRLAPNYGDFVTRPLEKVIEIC